MKERISVTPKILELNDSNDIYMTMNLRILSNQKNLNNAVFDSTFIEGVVSNNEKYVGLPFLVNKEALDNDEYLTHEFDPDTGELKTDQIGSFTKFWKEEDEDGVEVLMGSIRIFKRFKSTCEKIVEMVANDTLSTSCEVLVSDYAEVSEDGTRVIHYNDGKNVLIGSAIVSEPAMVSAKPTLLIAEAYKNDIQKMEECDNAIEGGDTVTKKNIEKNTENKYNNGIKVEYASSLEVASIEYYEIEKQIYNYINPVDPENGGRDYNYWIHTLYHDKVILENWDNGKLYSANYKVESETVVLEPSNDWLSGRFQFVPDGITVEELMENNTQKIKELESELNELKEEKENMSKKKDLTVEELNEKIEVLETEIAELKEKNEGLEATIVSQKEELIKAEETTTELNETIEELKVYKEKVETAEKEAKLAELSDKFSKLLDEETFVSEEVAQALENLDETALNSIVVAHVAKQKEEEVEKASKKGEEVVVNASKPKGMPKVKDANYWASTK